jgi:hypothetical protein
MKPIEIESWALRVLEQVESNHHVEDLRVELKSEWPRDFQKTARQLAGHANSARGDSILWIIGADEERGIITGTTYEDLAKWLPQVQSEFDGLFPSLMDINIKRKDKTVAALCFDTSRFPYVVKNPVFGQNLGGPVQYEVPWREGAKTRTAARDDLILMLSPLVKMPKVEVLAGELRFIAVSHYTGNSHLQLLLLTYVSLPDDAPITFPFHKCSSILTVDGNAIPNAFDIVLTTQKLRQQKIQAKKDGGPIFPTMRVVHDAIEPNDDEIVIRGCGKMLIEGKLDLIESLIGEWSEVGVNVKAVETVTNMEVSVNVKLVKQAGEAKLWLLQH